MTRILIPLLLLAGFSPAGPQPGEDGGEGFDPERFRQRVRNALNLTETQETGLRNLRSALEREVESVRRLVDAGVLSPEQGRERFRRALGAHTAERDRILSEDQRLFLARAREFIEERMIPAPPGGMKPGYLIDALELTEEQQRRWLDLLQRQRARYAAEEEESGFADAVGLLEEHRRAFEAMLTVEQRLELERIRAGWHGEADAADTTAVDTVEVDDPPIAGDEESWDEEYETAGDRSGD